MPLPTPTPNEIIQTLKHSNIKTVLVEGETESCIFRRIEEKLTGSQISVIKCGGRVSLLEIYSRKNEFSSTKTAFLADKDMFLYSNIPDEYKDIIWTKGYSIENDIYHGSQLLNKLLTTEQKENHDKLIFSYSKWYAHEVDKYLADKRYNVSKCFREVCDLTTLDISHRILSSGDYREPSGQILSFILDNYQLNIRGKNIFQILMHFLTEHPGLPKYSYSALLDIGVIDSNFNIEDLVSKLRHCLS